jgi:hypothetical protein
MLRSLCRYWIPDSRLWARCDRRQSKLCMYFQTRAQLSGPGQAFRSKSSIHHHPRHSAHLSSSRRMLSTFHRCTSNGMYIAWNARIWRWAMCRRWMADKLHSCLGSRPWFSQDGYHRHWSMLLPLFSRRMDSIRLHSRTTAGRN